ncbi:SpoIIE family protein phosphatase [Streptomyces chartreusis]|uniref:SpoIIE family protein phosphatase n=1 Tax=Streptomyces chartreusis TaxID=1969 RepID=UPI00380C05A4
MKPPIGPAAGAGSASALHGRAAEVAPKRATVLAGVALAAVYVLADESTALQLAETVGSPVAAYGLSPRYPTMSRFPASDSVRRGCPLWLSSAELASYQGTGTEAVPSGVSLGALPLSVDGRLMGCMVVVDHAGDGFDVTQRSLLELYADEVAVQLQGKGSPANRWAGGAAEALSLLGPNLDRQGVGSFTLALSTGRITADSRLFELFGIAPQSFDGRVETLLAHTVPDDLPVLMSKIESSQITTDGWELEFRICPPAGEARWLRLRCRMLCGPDGQPKQLIGVVADASSGRASANGGSRVQRLSATLAYAMTVRDVSRVVMSTLRTPLRADRVALAELQGDRLVVILLDPQEPSAWPQAWRTEGRSDQPEALASAMPRLMATIREGRASLWPAGAELEPALSCVGTGGLALLPLRADGPVVGACLIGWDDPHEFGPAERLLLTATADLVGHALRRAQGFGTEHELATLLQRSLLPRRLPKLAGGVAVARCLPAMAGLGVGGDWYDVIPLAEGRVALVIGDVEGHSAGSATIMGQIRTAVRAYAVEGHPPDVVVSHANRLLVGMETDLFATCCYIELDMEEGIAWLVRAGHLSPLLRQPDGSTQEVPAEGGPPLGVVADADFPLTTIGLSPGSLLTLLTDGLVESSTLHLDDGMRRMSEVLSAADPSDPARVADALLGTVGRRDDDVALLLLRYDGMQVRPIRASWTVWRLPDAVMHARRFTARTLRSWNVAEVGDVVLLIASELITNALVHTQGPVRLALALTAHRLKIAVSDSSPRAPAKPVIVDWGATGGRGILLVEAMSASWGSVPVSGGKEVWSEIVVSRREPHDTEAGPVTETV